MRQHIVQFDFENQPTMAFTKPVEILTTYNLHEIEIIFKKIEKALNNGYYVAGYVSYEAAPAFDSSYQVHDPSSMPLVWFGVYPDPESSLHFENNEMYQIAAWKNTISEKQYHQNIAKIQHAISEGFTYQVNYTTRLTSHFSGDSYSYYHQLRKNQGTSYSAFLDIGDHQIISVSPELFFKVHQNTITTKPMKGTVHRGKTLAEDIQLKKGLYESEKNRAENVMIVDLLRNDLGRIAIPGSVKVKQLFNIEPYPTVHQMTSTIEAKLAASSNVWQWFEALFPCGSITGAPKVETMKYIKKLENSPREVYCGAIGWISPDREATFNVPIRTVWLEKETGVAYYGTGSGVTWDSSSADEYKELIQKAAVLHENRSAFSLLESMLLKDGIFPLQFYHLERLQQSAEYFHFPYKEKEGKALLTEVATNYPNGCFKVRLMLNSSELNYTIEPIQTTTSPIKVRLAEDSIDKNNIFFYHKTTNRSIYQSFDQKLSEEHFTTLLWNNYGMVTEFTTGNVVFEKNGNYYTPPVSDGLLPGTLRAKLLEEEKITERQIRVDDIDLFERIWFINSVRGWLEVCLEV
ncbi:aminodeoxychorismate synthase component I [Gracilibacillus dipsosauri]|uniref:Aminodeoxychorismate synthase component I n=1 Tax=Gracilibacillus dipsosauri TaxID=178340 RepID=A0A317L615_9BACI|nr:aminodeoxychorismate synthase component I [Gracilibacillus dipsosauri]PWU69209.1 aminodeoxychorismate synthase component I [Gracilibacillus dipsosauri]